MTSPEQKPAGNGWSRRLEDLDQELAAVGVARDHGGSDGDRDGVVGDDGRRPLVVAGDGHGGTAAPTTAGGADDAHASGDDRPAGANGGDDDEEAEADDAATTAAKRRRAFIDWVVVIGVALFVAFLVRTFVLAHFVVDGVSMTSTLQDEDRVFVNKLSYRLHDPNRGDVVVLHQLNGTSERDLIKRVIGLPGENIQFRDCQVLIDGRALEEPYLDAEAQLPGSCGRDAGPVAIPDEHVFVMGDNRGGSMDSRDLGPISEDELVGRAFVVFWPSSNWQWL